MQPNSKNALIAVLIILVCAAVLITHWPALSAQAVSFDDNQYFVDNFLVRDPGWESVKRFLTEVFEPSTVKGYYQPLTMISLMLDYAAGGRTDSLTPFHRTSLLLHTANTALIIVLLYQLFGRAWIAAAVGLLFGVHPLTVEVISWTAERKTLLAAFFTLWSLVLYVRYVQKNNWKTFLSCVVMYVLALMSKPTSTPLPIMMLLMDYWPLKRLNKQTVLEKLPLFIIGGISAVITYISQSRAGSVIITGPYGPFQILLTVCHNIIFYLYKMIWPVNLSSYYPFSKPFVLSQPMVMIGVIGTFILILLLLVSLRRTRAALTGWLIFFVAIFPTMQVYRFSDVIAGDKFIYLPSIGILMILTSFLIWICGTNSARRHTARYITLAVIILILAGVEYFASRQYLAEWKDTVSLYRHMIKAVPEAMPPRTCLGVVLRKRGDVEQAIECFTEMLKIDPNNYIANINMGVAFASMGKLDKAVSYYNEAIRLSPTSAGIYRNLAMVLTAQGRFDEAVAAYRKGLENKPDHPEYLYDGLGMLLFQQGNVDEAISNCRQAIRLSPTTAGIYRNLARILVSQGLIDEAVAVYRDGLLHKPDHPEYLHKELGALLLQQGKIDEAIHELQIAVRLQPDSATCNSLGTVLASKGRIDEAMECHKKAIQLDPKNAEAYYNLGNIMIATGKFDQAADEYGKALRINPKYVKAHSNLAIALAQQGKLDEAIEHFTQVAKIEPNNVGVYYNLAMALGRQGRVDEAIDHFAKAAKIEPNNIEVHYALAGALADKNRLAESADEYRQVLRLEPNDVDTRCILGDILARQDRFMEAVVEYEKVLKINPKHPGALQGLENSPLKRVPPAAK